MKKSYLSALSFAFLLSGGVNAQVKAKEYRFGELSNNISTVKPLNTFNAATPKALGVTIWSDNFDNPSDWVIDNDGQTGAEFGWTIDATADGWWSSTGISSTSGGNFAEVANGDPTASPGTQVMNVTYTLTLANPLDIVALAAAQSLTNTGQVNLEFQEYGARFNDKQSVEISTDGGVTWTEVRNNLDYPVYSASGGAPYNNPENVVVNLAPFISGNATNVSIRFVWTSDFPSSTNPNAWVTYGWYLDDLKIVTHPDNDIEVLSSYWGTAGLNYYQIPDEQVVAIDFSTNIRNSGINNLTNVTLDLSVTGQETFNGSSTPVNSFATGATDSIVVSWTPTGGIGTYNIARAVSMNEIDDIPANNALPSITMDVTDHIYARDNNTPSGSFGYGGDPYELGNLFDIWQAQTLYSIDVQLHNTTNVGAFLIAKIYELDASGNLVALPNQSDIHQVTAADLNGILTLPLLTPQPLDANKTYFVGIQTDGDGGNTSDIVVTTAGTSDPGTSLLYDPMDNGGTWYYITGTPIVRMNFENTTGINEENQIGLAVYPNPVKDILTITFNEGNNASVKITDVTGKIVYTGTADKTEKINVSSFNDGIYFVTVSTETTSSTRKFVKK